MEKPSKVVDEQVGAVSMIRRLRLRKLDVSKSEVYISRKGLQYAGSAMLILTISLYLSLFYFARKRRKESIREKERGNHKRNATGVGSIDPTKISSTMDESSFCEEDKIDIIKNVEYSKNSKILVIRSIDASSRIEWTETSHVPLERQESSLSNYSDDCHESFDASMLSEMNSEEESGDDESYDDDVEHNVSESWLKWQADAENRGKSSCEVQLSSSIPATEDINLPTDIEWNEDGHEDDAEAVTETWLRHSFRNLEKIDDD